MPATQSNNPRLTASDNSQWKQNWTRPQHWYKIRWKPQNNWRVEMLQVLMASHQRCGKWRSSTQHHSSSAAAVIITLYKNKGENSDSSNNRGITLLSIAGKILARVLLNRKSFDTVSTTGLWNGKFLECLAVHQSSQPWSSHYMKIK